MMVKAVPSPPLSRSLLFLVLSLVSFIPPLLSVHRPVRPYHSPFLWSSHGSSMPSSSGRLSGPSQDQQTTSTGSITFSFNSIHSVLVGRFGPASRPTTTTDNNTCGAATRNVRKSSVRHQPTKTAGWRDRIPKHGFYSRRFNRTIGRRRILFPLVRLPGRRCLYFRWESLKSRLIDWVKGKEKKWRGKWKRKSGLWKKGKCEGQSDSQKGKVKVINGEKNKRHNSVFHLFFIIVDKEFTILAPSNQAPTRPSPTAADKDRVRQLLLNHIVLGRAVNISADLSSIDDGPGKNGKKPLVLTTLGGKQLYFKNRKGR